MKFLQTFFEIFWSAVWEGFCYREYAVAVSEILWLVVFCWLSMLMYKYQSMKMQGTGFCYSLQLLMCLSRLKLLRSAIKAMVWLIVAQLLSLSRERNVKPGAQCHRTDTIKRQTSSQMRMCISHLRVSSDNEHSWTCFDLDHLYITMILKLGRECTW